MGGGMSIEMWRAEREDGGVASEVQSNVFHELRREPALHDAALYVDVSDRVVTLSGTVRCYPEKVAAGRAARRVRGVRDVRNNVAVILPAPQQRSDDDLVYAALRLVGSDALVPGGEIGVGIVSGWVTLTGVVQRYADQQAAEGAIQRLVGVKGVTNRITVQPTTPATAAKARVMEVLRRSALPRPGRIRVEVRGGSALLRGRVRSLAERDEAVAAAAGAPGVAWVRDDLKIAG